MVASGRGGGDCLRRKQRAVAISEIIYIHIHIYIYITYNYSIFNREVDDVDIFSTCSAFVHW